MSLDLFPLAMLHISSPFQIISYSAQFQCNTHFVVFHNLMVTQVRHFNVLVYHRRWKVIFIKSKTSIQDHDEAFTRRLMCCFNFYVERAIYDQQILQRWLVGRRLPGAWPMPDDHKSCVSRVTLRKRPGCRQIRFVLPVLPVYIWQTRKS